jgi:hypothetical protein
MARLARCRSWRGGGFHAWNPGRSKCVPHGDALPGHGRPTNLHKLTSAASQWRPGGMQPDFTDAERAALALTVAITRLSGRANPVPDEIWDEAARHYDEPALAALVIAIVTINA